MAMVIDVHVRKAVRLSPQYRYNHPEKHWYIHLSNGRGEGTFKKMSNKMSKKLSKQKNWTDILEICHSPTEPWKWFYRRWCTHLHDNASVCISRLCFWVAVDSLKEILTNLAGRFPNLCSLELVKFSWDQTFSKNRVKPIKSSWWLWSTLFETICLKSNWINYFPSRFWGKNFKKLLKPISPGSYRRHTPWWCVCVFSTGDLCDVWKGWSIDEAMENCEDKMLATILSYSKRIQH